MMTKKPEINFKEYESVDALDKEEQALFDQLQEGKYQSVMTDELKAEYVAIFTENLYKKGVDLESSAALRHEMQLWNSKFSQDGLADL